MSIPDGVSPGVPFVQILDPATGTGTFLVEVIDQIEQKLKAKWRKAGKSDAEVLVLWNAYVPNHLLPRLNGFELMMAPYAIAHIKLGMKLHETGYQPKAGSPRVRVYLTNTLEEPTGLGDQSTMSFITESLALEAKGADEIKAKTPITVVIGNPPYSVYSLNKSGFIDELMKDYKKIDNQAIEETRIAPLMDDYCKFIRIADYFVSKSSRGIISYITNHSFLSGPVFRGLRYGLKSKSNIQITDLHGNYYRGDPANGDSNIFSIRAGVSINCFVFLPDTKKDILYTELRGASEEKLKKLLINKLPPSCIIKSAPPYYLWIPTDNSFEEYPLFESVEKIFPIGTLGMMTGKDPMMIDFESSKIRTKFREITDPNNSEGLLREKYEVSDSRDWRLNWARKIVFSEADIVPVNYRIFDIRYTYFHKDCLASPQSKVNNNLLRQNVALCVPRQLAALPYQHCIVSNHVTEMSYISNKTKEANRVFPLYLYPTNQLETEIRTNLDAAFAGRIASVIGFLYDSGIKVEQVALPLAEFQPEAPKQAAMSLPDPSMGRGDLTKTFGPRDVFDYIYAVLHSPAYRSRYADFLKSDFPRIPIPGNDDLFRELVALGKQLVALHLLDDRHARQLANPETRYIGKGEARVEKSYPKYENGKVMINASCWFEDVPPEVWNFHIGGYQVCEKWLADRAAKGGKNPKSGRVLAEADILHYRRMTIALRETIRLMAEIDGIINTHGGWPGAFQGCEQADQRKMEAVS